MDTGDIFDLSSDGKIRFKTQSSDIALTLDTSQNATFAGIVGIGGTGIYAGTATQLNLPGRGLAIKNDKNGSSNNWSYINNTATGSSSNINFHTGNNAAALTLAHNGDATFAVDITVNGGDITLGGTGRIQGIDTVSAGTDAANKDYVDTAVAGSGSGTVTGVSSATTSQLTVSQSSPAPELSIVTAAVTNGGTALATGDQIYDATTTRLGSYLPLSGGTITGNVKFNDNVELRLGSGADLKAYHTGTHTYFDNNVGNLEFTNNAVDKSIFFKANEGTGAEAYLGLLPSFPGVFVYKDLLLATDGNGGKIKLGQSQDLEIYHDGSNSYINETGTGNLYIKSASSLVLSNITSGSVWIECINNQVELKNAGSTKLTTTSDGVTVTGQITTTGTSPSVLFNETDVTANWRNRVSSGSYRVQYASDGTTFSDYFVLGASANTVEKDTTFAGDITLGPSSSIVLDDTPTASTASGSGTIVNWSVSVSTTAGNLYVIKTDGGWTTADADSEAKSTAMAAIALGSNATAGMLLQGFFYKAGHGFAIGSPLYISNTAGAFSNSRPTGTGDYVRIIGYATSTNYIYFDPDKTWVKID